MSESCTRQFNLKINPDLGPPPGAGNQIDFTDMDWTIKTVNSYDYPASETFSYASGNIVQIRSNPSDTDFIARYIVGSIPSHTGLATTCNLRIDNVVSSIDKWIASVTIKVGGVSWLAHGAGFGESNVLLWSWTNNNYPSLTLLGAQTDLAFPIPDCREQLVEVVIGINPIGGAPKQYSWDVTLSPPDPVVP